MNGKEKWVNETLEGFIGMEAARMDAALRTRILGKMQLPVSKVICINRNTVLQAVAAIALLVALNVFSISHFMKAASASPQRATNAFSQEYFSYVNQPVSL